MIKNIFKYLSKIDTLLYLILIFCILGCVRNILILKYIGLDYTYFATKVCIAMLLIYFSQSVLILLRQRPVFIISIIQCIFCIFVYKDFTFIPLVNWLNIIKSYVMPNLTYGEEYFFGFACVSFLFCMEILKTYLLYALTDQANFNKKKVLLK